MSVIEIENLVHVYGGGRVALDGLSLDIAGGEIFGFLGPNGSGKTTLFRILCTLISPQRGRVRVLGHDLPSGRNEVRRHIGVVFQSPALDKQLTAEENLLHQGHLYGLRGADLKRRSAELLARVGLADRAAERVASFSGGMRRRVELAKGLLHEPQLLLLDEPSTGLDPRARLELWQHLRQVRDAGVTVLLTTHLMDEADHCTRLAVLDGGRLVAADTPAGLKERIGGDVITISASDPPAVRYILRETFSLTAQETDGVLRVERPRGHEFLPLLVESCPGLIESVSVGRPTLQDVFVRLTGHGFDEEAAR